MRPIKLLCIADHCYGDDGPDVEFLGEYTAVGLFKCNGRGFYILEGKPGCGYETAAFLALTGLDANNLHPRQRRRRITAQLILEFVLLTAFCLL